MALWDSLPPAERRKYIHARLTPGRILLLHCDFTTPPKEKFLVVVGVEPELLFFVINSKINEFIRRQKALFQCQVEITQQGHPFLNYHSYIDCTTAHNVAPRSLYEQIEGDINRLKGEISQSVREQIIAAVKFAKTLPGKHRAEILRALDQCS